MAPGPAAAGPARAAGDTALAQGVRDILGAWEKFVMVLCPVNISYDVAVMLGYILGDKGMRTVEVAVVVSLFAAVLACRFGGLSRQAEVDASLVVIFSGLIAIPSYTLLCPWTQQEGLTTIVATFPVAMCTLMSAGVACEMGGMRGVRAGAEYVVVSVVALAALARCVYDVNARSTLQQLFLLLPISLLQARLMRSFAAAFLDSQQRLKDEHSATESAMRGLANSHRALSRVLRALCNVVMEVDVDLNLRNPTWQVHDLLMGGGQGDPQELQGRSLLDFTATEGDAAKLRSFMSAEVEQALGRPSEQCQQGPASAVTLEMQDSQGVRFSARLYDACLVDDSGVPSHLLGGCLQQDLAAQRAPPPPADAHLGLPWDEDQYEPTPAQIQAMLPRLRRATSSASSSQGGDEEWRDPSRIAMRFDAGTTAFTFTQGNVLTGSQRKSKRLGVLGLIGQADTRPFERWVVEEVHDHFTAMRTGQAFQSTPFAGQLNLKLPWATSQQVLQPEVVWLQHHEATHDEEIPLTLWLQGVRMLDRSQALEVLAEEEVDAASEDSEDVALDSISVARSA